MTTTLHLPRSGQQAGQHRRNVGPASGLSTNVGETERLLSALGGGALVLIGLTGGRGLGRLLLPAAGGMLAYRGLSGHCSLYSALGIDTAGRAPATAVRAGAGVKVEESITVNRPAEELYRYWRRLSTLPRFMENLKEVRPIDDRRSHWVAEAPLGVTVEWDAEIINDEHNHLIAWRSLPGSRLATAGSVHFDRVPGGRGTEVVVSMKYDPPGGKAGAAIAWLFGESPQKQLREDLERFKQLMESGEYAGAMRSPARAKKR